MVISLEQVLARKKSDSPQQTTELETQGLLPSSASESADASSEAGQAGFLQYLAKRFRLGETVDASVSPVESKAILRRSLAASSYDGILSEVFENSTKGVLLSNFLVDLGAGPIAVGLLMSIPLLVNLLQPLGAQLSERVPSRHWYSLPLYCLSRSLWLILLAGILSLPLVCISSNALIAITLTVVLVSGLVGALGYAAWMGWMAALIPRRLRGRYLGRRYSLSGLTQLIGVPIAGWFISAWSGGRLQGYGIVLAVGILFGLVALSCQFFIQDVNPQAEQAKAALVKVGSFSSQDEDETRGEDLVTSVVASAPVSPATSISATGVAPVSSTQSLSPAQTAHRLVEDVPHNPWQDVNFRMLLAFLGLSMFGMYLCLPFFNFYMLDELQIDLRWVTLYNSLMAGAYLSSLLCWGNLADRWGNRPLLIMGTLGAILMPVLWLCVGNGVISRWLILPVLHLLQGSAWLSMELCRNNIQLALAPPAQPTRYVATASAVLGLSGATGATLGSLLAHYFPSQGMVPLFVLSALLQGAALVPLLLVKEGCDLRSRWQSWLRGSRLFFRWG